MNKNKKIAMAVVSTVMAGAMTVPLAACNNNEDLGPKVDLGEAWNVFKTDGSGDIDYSVYQRENPVKLTVSIGYKETTTGTSYPTGTTFTLADGNTYVDGEMKPAWKQMSEDLHITWEDTYSGLETSKNLDDLITRKVYANTDIYTTDLSVVVRKVAQRTSVLNLADYLDYMPNFKAFLEENPVVYLSLLQDGMSTTDGSNKKLYIAPYFDGYDDIERYCIIRQDWADKLLNGDAALSAGTALGKDVAVEAFMPKKGALELPVTIDSGDHTAVGKIYKNYDNVKAELNKTTSALRIAYDAASNNAAVGESGNIIDIMNAAITANKTVTGDKLVALFRAYIDACYTTGSEVGSASYYTADKRSNLFNGYDAAWDVDDLVAMLRCVMTNQSTVLDGTLSGANKVYGIAPRQGTNDRTPDMVRLACQLYGARGADSRLEYTYIDNEGNLKDARNEASYYEALDKFNKLREEGLIADYSGISGFKNEGGYVTATSSVEGVETFMMYDYCQTQTKNGFYRIGTGGASGTNVARAYNFAPILTPVSQWDVNDNDEIDDDEYFRFTESWRSTKTSGIALNGNLAYNKDKLKAALQFVDYLYSEDGQIVSTFGPKATDEQGIGGFWYGEVQSNPQETTYDADGNVVTSKNYFTYKGVKYQGYSYKGDVAPKLTKNVTDSFQNKAGATGSVTTSKVGATLSFTDYARILMGTTLPVGVKNQAFEDQLTSSIGKAGSAKVATALANKVPGTDYTVVRGMSLKMDSNNWWYTCVPTGLPVPSNYVSSLSGTSMNKIRYLSGEAKNSGTEFMSIFNSIILYGVKSGSQHKSQDITYQFTNIADLVKYMSEENHADTRENVYGRGWNNAKEYWNYLKADKTN